MVPKKFRRHFSIQLCGKNFGSKQQSFRAEQKFLSRRWTITIISNKWYISHILSHYIFATRCVCACTCAKERKNVSAWVRERACVKVRENEKESGWVWVWASVRFWLKTTRVRVWPCVWVNECESIRVCVCVSGCEREREIERERGRDWICIQKRRGTSERWQTQPLQKIGRSECHAHQASFCQRGGAGRGGGGRV